VLGAIALSEVSDRRRLPLVLALLGRVFAAVDPAPQFSLASARAAAALQSG
jgi:hypothetical protein